MCARTRVCARVCLCEGACGFLEQSALQVISTESLLTASRMRPCLTDGDKNQNKKTLLPLFGDPYLAWVPTTHSEVLKMVAKVRNREFSF